VQALDPRLLLRRALPFPLADSHPLARIEDLLRATQGDAKIRGAGSRAMTTEAGRCSHSQSDNISHIDMVDDQHSILSSPLSLPISHIDIQDDHIDMAGHTSISHLCPISHINLPYRYRIISCHSAHAPLVSQFMS
jgi:hypothetical protein